MKFTSVLLIAALLIGGCSGGKEEVNTENASESSGEVSTPSLEESITGQWTFLDFGFDFAMVSYNGVATANLSDEAKTAADKLMEENKEAVSTAADGMREMLATSYITINADKSYEANLGGEVEKGTWELTGDLMAITNEEGKVSEFNVEVNKGNLALFRNDPAESRTVTGEDGVDISYEFTSTTKLDFKKQ